MSLSVHYLFLFLSRSVHLSLTIYDWMLVVLTNLELREHRLVGRVMLLVVAFFETILIVRDALLLYPAKDKKKKPTKH
jgi:hypothetical protein